MNKALMGLVGIATAVFVALCAGSDALAQAETRNEVKEIMITVDPKIIALPGNSVSEVPLSAVRVRSTDLRDLNREYGVVSIEAVYKLAEKEKGGGLLVSTPKEKVDRAGKIKKLLREKENKNKEMILVEGAYIIRLEDYEDKEGNPITVDLNNAITAYGALPVVISAGPINFDVLDLSPKAKDESKEKEKKEKTRKR